MARTEPTMGRGPDVIPGPAEFGAEVAGLDLSQRLDAATAERVRRAFVAHRVIYFRDQELGAAQILQVASLFGEPADYPFAEGLPECSLVTEIVKEASESINFGGEWHSDTTYLEVPPRATVLYAVEVPARGGDTLFADMYRAYEDLSAGMRRLLDPMRATFTAALLPRDKRDGYATMKGRNVDKLSMSAKHPVVRTHPCTGRRSLYINSTHTSCFEGMSREESLPLIEYLCERAVRPEHCFRLRWEAGTLTVWDNRCTQHYAVNDYHGQRRVMRRVIVAGERPG